jgi:hypothetical protein
MRARLTLVTTYFELIEWIISMSPTRGIKKTTTRRSRTEILQNSKYDHSNIVICWRHGEILELAAALGVDANRLPPESHWPSPPWPGEVFGWLLQVCYDADGSLIPSQTFCINQQLMYDDYGKNPPTIG